MTILNPEQQRAAEFGFGVCAVIAVPGSGKTLTMTHRIANLVNQHGVDPESILGVTFTRNAAQAMAKRLKAIMGNLADRVNLCTMHSFCLSLLRNEGLTFQVLQGREQLFLLKGILKKLGMDDLPTGRVLQEISLAKNNLIRADEFMELHREDLVMGRVAVAYTEYEKQKTERLLLDFDDMPMEAYRLLSEQEGIRRKIITRYLHIMVDEFQDTNPVQMEVLKLLVTRDHSESSFFVVGDDWQSIYAFTGASVGSILGFQNMFPGAEQLMLSMNYRSTPQILNCCQNLISYNTRKIDKELRTDTSDGNPVVVLESSSEDTEAQAVLNEIEELVGRRGYRHKDIAVLYRANFLSRIMEEAFTQRQLPYHIQNGQCFYDRHEVKVLLDYLRLIHDPYSQEGDAALAKVINTPNRYLGRKFVERLRREAQEAGLSLYETLAIMHVTQSWQRQHVQGFVELMDSFMARAHKLEPAEAIQLLRSALDYDRQLTDEDIPSPDNPRVQNIDQLQMAAGRYRDIGSFLDFTDSFREAEVHDTEGVQLMTIHKAKGLEFPVVFLVGLVEGITPTKRGDLEEERRIVFVAISRAMERLYLSYSHTHLGAQVKKSLFIDEMMGRVKTSEA